MNGCKASVALDDYLDDYKGGARWRALLYNLFTKSLEPSQETPFELSEQNQDWQLGLAVGALYAARKLILRRRDDRLRRVGQLRQLHCPPANAEFLFYLFLDAANCDAFIGDLEERYRVILRKLGKRRADVWYWTLAIRSVGPIAWTWGR